MNDIQLPWSFFNIHGLEFNGQISFLKAGLYYADHITAVSPTYAREITEPQFAYGMEGLLQQRHREGRLSGVLNGVGRENLESRDGLTVGLALHPAIRWKIKRKISASYKSQWGLRLTIKCRFLQW